MGGEQSHQPQEEQHDAAMHLEDAPITRRCARIRKLLALTDLMNEN